jgi:hypothetical protein
MTINSTSIIDKIEILQDGTIQIRQAQVITESGNEIARNFTRWVRHPGDTSAQNDPSPIPAIASLLWTDEIISSYQSSLQNNK